MSDTDRIKIDEFSDGCTASEKPFKPVSSFQPLTVEILRERLCKDDTLPYVVRNKHAKERGIIVAFHMERERLVIVYDTSAGYYINTDENGNSNYRVSVFNPGEEPSPYLSSARLEDLEISDDPFDLIFTA